MEKNSDFKSKSKDFSMEDTVTEKSTTGDGIFPILLPRSVLMAICIFLAKEEEKGKGKKTERVQEGRGRIID